MWQEEPCIFKMYDRFKAANAAEELYACVASCNSLMPLEVSPHGLISSLSTYNALEVVLFVVEPSFCNLSL
jgi:hypothetical protein